MKLQLPKTTTLLVIVVVEAVAPIHGVLEAVIVGDQVETIVEEGVEAVEADQVVEELVLNVVKKAICHVNVPMVAAGEEVGEVAAVELAEAVRVSSVVKKAICLANVQMAILAEVHQGMFNFILLEYDDD